jgi:hypothetical protein
MNPANTRSIRRLAVAAIATLAAGAALAAPQLQTHEECLESGTRDVSLPGIASGTVTANPCSGCPSLRLRLDAKTRYFIGKEQVPYARFREAAAKGDLRLDLYYEPKSRTLNRVRLATAGAAN